MAALLQRSAINANTRVSASRPRRNVRVMAATALSQDELKKQAAHKAVEYVKSGMVVGLGTGSTAAFAVDRIGQLMKEGKLKDIIGVPTSVRTYEQAKSLGIPLATLDEQPKIDVAIDGADEVDPQLDVVKGRGGALLREKMVEKASKMFVCIVDDSKWVTGLGGSQLAMPVEIVQFCHKYTLQRLAALKEVAGCEAKLRMNGDKPYVTDNSNYIVDLYFKTPIKDSAAAAKAIIELDGVVVSNTPRGSCRQCRRLAVLEGGCCMGEAAAVIRGAAFASTARALRPGQPRWQRHCSQRLLQSSRTYHRYKPHTWCPMLLGFTLKASGRQRRTLACASPALSLTLGSSRATFLPFPLPPRLKRRQDHGLFLDMVDVCITAGKNGVEVKERPKKK